MRRFVGAIAAVTLIGGLFAAPASARIARGGAPDGETTASYIVPTRHGKIYLEVVHPTKGGDIVKAPAILTYSPYDAALASRNADAADFVPKGYARATADLVGTGNSGGCYDYGGKRERESGYDLVEWIAKQKWSTGKIAMYGGSYEGTTATAAAVERPPHLTTIVPVAAISRWYGYAYSGGIRYTYNNEWIGHEGASAVDDEGFDTPLAFDFGLAIPPPIDAHNADWAGRVQSTITPCDEVAHTEHGYDDTPDYDKFWLERDYVKDAGKVMIPVLVAGNWGDWNVKQEESWNLYKALDNSKKRVLYMGSRWDDHGGPVHGTAAKNKYEATVLKWFDHYLMGKDNGIDNLPSVISQTANLDGRGKWSAGAPKTRNLTLYAQYEPPTRPGQYAWKLNPYKPRPPIAIPGQSSEPPSSAFPITNANLETHGLHHGQANHEWFWFESPILTKDLHVFGQPKLQIYSSVGREWVTLTPTIGDMDHARMIMRNGIHVANTDKNMVVGTTRGFLDSRYRNGLSKQKPVEPGKPFEATVEMKPIDYVFKAGHFIGLNIQSEIVEWMLPKPYAGCEQLPDVSDPTKVRQKESCATLFIHTEEARTRLILPVIDAPKNPTSLFCFKPSGCHIHE
ncbi:MAG TPA: CocE/NonD family hydrolase [Actinomycetota bacterium]|nr:CocE/NonD family hydrolase [Actinomycetota bacterium]